MSATRTCSSAGGDRPCSDDPGYIASERLETTFHTAKGSLADAAAPCRDCHGSGHEAGRARPGFPRGRAPGAGIGRSWPERQSRAAPKLLRDVLREQLPDVQERRSWTTGPTRERRCPDDESLTVGEAFIQEQARLLALPGNAFPTEEVKAVSAGKTPYVRFDRNDYSIPHACVSRTLTVAADLATVRILDGQVVIATHPRSFDRQQQIECPEHIATLVEHKHAAHAHRGADQLINLCRSPDYIRSTPICAAISRRQISTEIHRRQHQLLRIT